MSFFSLPSVTVVPTRVKDGAAEIIHAIFYIQPAACKQVKQKFFIYKKF